ncbi:hypothetical protein ACVW0P_002597 [Mucilaginibacter sp. UYNi724]
MANATGGQVLDFKTNNIKNRPVGQTLEQYMYRGMPVDDIPGLGNKNGIPTIASARDIGNIGAGFEAAYHGLNWAQTRIGFDALQSIQDRGLSLEGETSQSAQRMGFRMGAAAYEAAHPWMSVGTLEKPFPAH